MPYYDHNKDYPFAAFITNLGKYNEGELVGKWVKFPTTAEELKEVFKRIGIGQKDDFGQPYEEWFITDYDCYVDGLYSKLGEYESLDELNYLASKLDEMSESEYAQFQAGMEMGDHCGSLQEIINLTENLDCYEVYPDIHDYDDLGRYYIEELDVMQVPEHLQNYIDYEAYGRDVALEENGTFTDQGYVRDTGDSSVKPENYELVYTAPLTEQDSLESIYTRFNINHPADFKGHSLSVSDIVVLHQDGENTAHYCDRFGFSQVPEFLQPERAAEVTIPTPDQMATQERISTPRGSFCVTNMTREQMEAAGYGVHHQSDDGKYLIMGNGTRAFAVLAQQPEQDNPLRTAEMTLEDDYGMIDGVINNGRRGEELEKAQEYADRTTPEKPSIRERLEDAKRECAEHKPPEGKKPGRDVPEHDCL